MTIYIDITQLERQRVNTGIQRVVKEFLQRAVVDSNQVSYKVLIYNTKLKKMQILLNEEVTLFLQDIANYKFTKKKIIDIETIKAIENMIFFDIDSPWNAPYKRAELYPILKNNGFKIFNFLYDMIPILMPEFVQQTTIKNFKPFIKSVCKYSDTVLCDSISAQTDFLKYKSTLNIKRDISTKVVGLGSNFLLLKEKEKVKDIRIKSILDKKYILFVGTLEPRKNQEDLLDAFDILSKKYSDLNLVLIGMKGWKVDKFIDRINSHPLKDNRLFWLNNIDDDTLYHFYQNAFIVTYLSKYEGYGLPIIESLQHSNVTITSNNSSMPEVGLDLVEYIENHDLNQLEKTLSQYIENKELYNQRKQYIKDNFKLFTWDQFYDKVFSNLESSRKKQKMSIKSIPFIGWLARWSYNLLRLNNLRHIVNQQQKQIKQLKKQQKYFDEKLEQKIASLIAKQISIQSDAFTQRLEQFIFDSKMDLNLIKEKDKDESN